MLICKISCLHYKSFSQEQHCQKCVNIGLYNDISIIINFQILVSAQFDKSVEFFGVQDFGLLYA